MKRQGNLQRNWFLKAQFEKCTESAEVVPGRKNFQVCFKCEKEFLKFSQCSRY